MKSESNPHGQWADTVRMVLCLPLLLRAARVRRSHVSSSRCRGVWLQNIGCPYEPLCPTLSFRNTCPSATPAPTTHFGSSAQARTLKSLTTTERAAVALEHRMDPLPDGCYFDGTQFLVRGRTPVRCVVFGQNGLGLLGMLVSVEANVLSSVSVNVSASASLSGPGRACLAICIVSAGLHPECRCRSASSSMQVQAYRILYQYAGAGAGAGLLHSPCRVAEHSGDT